MPRSGSYLYKRKGSQNWWLRLYLPGTRGKTKFEMSLGTPDRTEAEVIASEPIRGHKLLLIGRRSQVTGFGPRWEPGEHFLKDGTRIVATKKEVAVFDSPDGKPRIVKNKMGFKFKESAADARLADQLTGHYRNKDDSIIETWIKQQAVGKHLASEARNVWRLFKEVVGNKPLAQCSREDGRKLVEALRARGNQYQTIAKKVGHLRAAVNLAIDDPHSRLQHNPFSKIVPKSRDKLRRLPLSHSDMASVRDHLHELRDEDQLLWKVMATTGMRPSEAFNIREEFKEDGIRYVMIGRKSLTSERRVPLPKPLLPFLPRKITGPLFTDTPKNAGKRLNRWLRRHGISRDSKNDTGDMRKVAYSLRHRAKDRLRAVGCPVDVQDQLLGHNKRTVSDGYGIGHPMPLLKKWIDKVGY